MRQCLGPVHTQVRLMNKCCEMSPKSVTIKNIICFVLLRGFSGYRIQHLLHTGFVKYTNKQKKQVHEQNELTSRGWQLRYKVFCVDLSSLQSRFSTYILTLDLLNEDYSGGLSNWGAAPKWAHFRGGTFSQWPILLDIARSTYMSSLGLESQVGMDRTRPWATLAPGEAANTEALDMLTNCSSLSCVAQSHCTYTLSLIHTLIKHILLPSILTLAFLCQHPLLLSLPYCLHDCKNWSVFWVCDMTRYMAPMQLWKGYGLEYLGGYLSKKLQVVWKKHTGTEATMAMPIQHST